MTSHDEEIFEVEEFRELLTYTFTGFIGGLLFGVLFDSIGWKRSGLAQWFVRTLSGESESLFEGFFAMKQRLQKKRTSMAEIYGWGKFIGITIPWWIDLISRLSGVEVYGVSGFYIPYFYAMTDQIGANIAGGIYLYRKTRSIKEAFKLYIQNALMLSSLIIIFLVPIGLFLARILGFTPDTQVKTALETIVSNLCWIPPLIAFYVEKRKEQKHNSQET